MTDGKPADNGGKPNLTVATPEPGDQDKTSSPTSNRAPTSFLAVPHVNDRGRLSDDAPSVGSDTTKVPLEAGEDDESDPLRPDPGNEQEFIVHDQRFAFSPGQLGKLINPKSLRAFHALGGIKGLELGLRTDVKAGLSADEVELDGHVTFEQATGKPDRSPGKDAVAPEAPAQHSGQFTDRIRIFGNNRLPEKKGKNIFELMWIVFNDKILILLSICAVVSLALGLYQTFGVEHLPGDDEVHWVDGVAIIIAILIVVIVGAANDWQKERQFVKLNRKKEDRVVNVVRSGKTQQISIYDILVGDVVHLEPGDLIPVDGIFISGHNVKCDESSATGESDQLKKTAAAEVFARLESGDDCRKLDPFILSGAKVLEGTGTFIATSVGVHSAHGKTMMALREETEATPLQVKLNRLAEGIAKLGGASALLLFLVLFIKFLVGLRNNPGNAAAKGRQFMDILITAVTVVVVAVPEGLPLAVTLALAFATTRMLKDNNLVRLLRACEVAGGATTICSDKTGTLTQNLMTVVAGTVGTVFRFGGDKSESDGKTSSTITEFPRLLSDATKALLVEGIALNSTAFEGEENGKITFIGSKTETALLNFATEHFGMGPVSHIRESAITVQVIPFDSGRKCMGIVVKRDDGTYRLYVKGASELVLERCSQVVNGGVSETLTANTLTAEDVDSLKSTINTYAERSLRTIGLVYRDFPSWPPPGVRPLADDPNQVDFSHIYEQLVFIGIVGIQDPLRIGVKEAVEKCQKAGIFVRMVTGDNLVTARAIATECGIFTPGGLVMEGPKFRTLTKAEMDQAIPRLQVLARSSPEDKRILVKRLKELGETVAVTGDGTNDAPALKMADVGFSMGIAGTEVAKEASAIILMDDNFASIVKAIMWGRAVNDAVKKFLQFQLTVNITAVVTTFVTAVSRGSGESVLSAVQLLWVNLIMDTLAALALATDPPTESILDRKPDSKSMPLITLNMWKMILGQAVYQLVVVFVLYFGGMQIFGYDVENPDVRGIYQRQLSGMIFNTFVWMQIFNQLNSRRLDNKFNIFEGLHSNWLFIAISGVMVGGQVLIMFVGDAAFKVSPNINGVQWAVSLVLGAIALPVGVIIRLIPDELLMKILPSWMHHKHDSNIYVGNDDRFQWNDGIEAVRDELTFLKTIRGGRISQLKFARKDLRRLIPGSRNNSKEPSFNGDSENGGASSTPQHSSSRRRRSRSNSAVAIATMVPSIVAGSIAGWSPIEKLPEDGDRFGKREDLEKAEGADLHPATSTSDPVIAEPQGSKKTDKP